MDTLGIYLDAPFKKEATLKKKGSTIRIVSLKTSKENEVSITRSKSFIVSVLSAKDAFLKSAKLPAKVGSNFKSALKFKFESSTVLPLDEFITSILIKKGKSEIEADFYAVSKKALKEHINALSSIKLEPNQLTIVPKALSNFINWKFPDLKSAILIDIASTETHVILVEEGKLKKFHQVPVGVETLKEALYEDRKRFFLKSEIEGAAKQIDLLAIKPKINPNLATALNDLHDGVFKIIYSFSQNEKTPHIITGRLDAFKHLQELIIGKNPTMYPLSIEEQTYAVSIGSALEKYQKEPLSFLKDIFFSNKMWKKMGLFGFILLSFSLILSSMFFYFATKLEKEKKIALTNELSSITSSSMVDLDAWIVNQENIKASILPSKKGVKFSEFVAWLSRKQNDVDIIDLQFKNVSFPKLETPQTSLVTKVDITFKATSNTQARQFHDQIMKDAVMVDSAKEVRLEHLKDSYSLSFYLKGKG